MSLFDRISHLNRTGFLLIVAVIILLICASQSFAGVVTFGSGDNQFQMEFVTIGNAGNTADTTGAPNPAGGVGYVFGIGTYEVSEDMITKYNANFGVANALVITKDSRGPNKPATSVSWNEAARFVNWLNTSQGYKEAYKFATGSGINDNIQLWDSNEAGYKSSNRYRNDLAKYVLPGYNEWYKAAYYNPSTSSYHAYPTSDGSLPTAVTSGQEDKTAVYNQSFPQGPADVDKAGGLSSYGVMGLGGNVWEWEESSFDLANSSGSSFRGGRGGRWYDNSSSMSSSFRLEYGIPSDGYLDVGFRVVSLSISAPPAVPEPSTMAIFGLGILGATHRSRRKNKAYRAIRCLIVRHSR